MSLFVNEKAMEESATRLMDDFVTRLTAELVPHAMADFAQTVVPALEKAAVKALDGLEVEITVKIKAKPEGQKMLDAGAASG